MQLARTYHIPAERIEEAITELRVRELIEAPSAPANPTRTIGRLTDMGCAVLTRLVAARREHLAELVAEWDATKGVDAATYLTGAVRDMIADVRRPA
jgi:hypothetical protein